MLAWHEALVRTSKTLDKVSWPKIFLSIVGQPLRKQIKYKPGQVVLIVPTKYTIYNILIFVSN